MGRSPCCSKEGLNRGAWTAQEDRILSGYIKAHGEGKWRNLPRKAGLKRCGKSCRLRWLNYLRPDIKRGNISPDEEELIIRLHKLLGNRNRISLSLPASSADVSRWSLIAGRLPGRTDNEIKNYWNTTLGKKHQASHAKTKLSLDTGSGRLPSRPKSIAETPLVRTKASKCSKQAFLNPWPERPERLNTNIASPQTPDHQTSEPSEPAPGDENAPSSTLTNSEDNNISTGHVLDFHIEDVCFPDLLNCPEFSALPACSLLDHQPGMMFYEEVDTDLGLDMHPFVLFDFHTGEDHQRLG